MLRLRLTLTAMLLLPTGLISAQELPPPPPPSRWLYVGVNKDHTTTTYVDRDFRTLGNGNRLGWIKHVDSDGTSALSRTEYNCGVATTRMFDWLRYDKQGKLANQGNDPSPAWEGIVPDTVGEAVMRYVCGMTKRSTPKPAPAPPPSRGSTPTAEYRGLREQSHIVAMQHMDAAGWEGCVKVTGSGTIVKRDYADDAPLMVSGFAMQERDGERSYWNVNYVYLRNNLSMVDLDWLPRLFKVGNHVSVTGYACGAGGRVVTLDGIRLIEPPPPSPRSAPKTVKTIKTGIYPL